MTYWAVVILACLALWLGVMLGFGAADQWHKWQKRKKGKTTMELEKGWLKCDLSEGMFSNEFTATFHNVNEEVFSFFVDQSLVDPKRFMLKVNIIECKGEHCIIHLPVEPIDGSGRTVTVFQENVKRVA